MNNQLTIAESVIAPKKRCASLLLEDPQRIAPPGNAPKSFEAFA